MKLELRKREAKLILEALELLYGECERVNTNNADVEVLVKLRYKMKVIEDIEGDIISNIKK